MNQCYEDWRCHPLAFKFKNSFTLVCCNAGEYKADLGPTAPKISSHSIKSSLCFHFSTQVSWLSLIPPSNAKADQHCSYDSYRCLITELQELFDSAGQLNVFGRVTLKRLIPEKVITALIATETLIALITIQDQYFSYDLMANEVTVGGSNWLTFVRNIFVGLFIGWGAFIASHQDLICCSYKQK